MKVFKCFICGKLYTNKNHLHVYTLKHDPCTIAKTCRVCSKRFTQKNNLNSHMKIVHGSPRGSKWMKNAIKVHKGPLLNCDQATSTDTSHDEPVVPCAGTTPAVTFTQDWEPTGAVTETLSLPQQNGATWTEATPARTMKVVKDPMFCSRNPYSTAVMATDTFTVIELDSEESEVDELDEDRVCLGNGIPVLLPTQMATDTSTVIELDRDESEVDELDENRVCLGNEIPILLDIEQSLKQRLLRRTPEQDLLISQWCRDTKQIFEKWNLDFKTILILFDVSALRNSEADRLKIVRARDVENINESTPVYVLSKVIAAHTQAEVLLQLRHEYDQFEYGCNFDAGLFDSFYVKCQKITSLWGWSESLSYSILSKLFDNL